MEFSSLGVVSSLYRRAQFIWPSEDELPALFSHLSHISGCCPIRVAILQASQLTIIYIILSSLNIFILSPFSSLQNWKLYIKFNAKFAPKPMVLRWKLICRTNIAISYQFVKFSVQLHNWQPNLASWWKYFLKKKTNRV